MRLVVADLDTNDQATGKYQDAVTFTGTGPSGVVTPTATATSALIVITGNTATASATVTNVYNCNTTESAQSNATFNYDASVSAVSMTYFNGSTAYGTPPNQAIGVSGMGFCVQNPDLALVKNDGDASFVAGSSDTYTFTVSNVGSAATSGTTTVKDILPAGMSFTAPLTSGGANGGLYTCAVSTIATTNETATCTTTTAIAAGGTNVLTLPVAVAATVAGTTLTNRAKVFGGNDPNKTAETTTGATSACASDSLAGAVVNAGCGFEDTPIITAASVVITKTDSKTIATSGGTNNYVVTCSVAVNGAVCPAGPLTIANLTGTCITVATLPVNGALQFAYTFNVN